MFGMHLTMVSWFVCSLSFSTETPATMLKSTAFFGNTPHSGRNTRGTSMGFTPNTTMSLPVTAAALSVVRVMSPCSVCEVAY
jgi:hypothetical protein